MRHPPPRTLKPPLQPLYPPNTPNPVFCPGPPAPYHESIELLQQIQQFDTCTIANAIERFGVRLRNEGYTRPGLRCVTGGSPRVAGYAATCRVRLSDPPVKGRTYEDRTDWWDDIESLPAPRIAVIQDIELEPGDGSVVGQVHAAILKAFHCAALVTNGAVRHIPVVAAMGFPMFAHSVTVSHAYMHMVDYGTPVEIFGLQVSSGDLLFADCHGVISIPRHIAADVVSVADEISRQARRIIDLCQSPDFTREKLLEAVKNV